MSKKSKKGAPVLAQWLEPECAVEDERCVGVTVARKVSLNRIDYEGAITVEVFGSLGRGSNDALDGDWPETWSGDESVTLTAGGARRLAHILTAAAMTSDSHRKALGLWVADAPKERDAVHEAIAAALDEAGAALTAMRAKTIEECVAAALTHTTAPGLALSEPGADPTQIALARVVHRAVTAVVDTLRALAAQRPAAREPADVDPEASAYR